MIRFLKDAQIGHIKSNSLARISSLLLELFLKVNPRLTPLASVSLLPHLTDATTEVSVRLTYVVAVSSTVVVSVK